jgi:6-phosphogluconolactonase
MRPAGLLRPLVLTVVLAPPAAFGADTLVFFGTHAEGPGRGLSVARFDVATGAITSPSLVAEAAAPAFFVLSADGRRLYTCNSLDTYQVQAGGAVSAYAVDPKSGRLTLLNEKPTGGGEPAYVSLDATGRFVLVANYNGGSVAVFALGPDGRLAERTAFVQHEGRSVHPERQTGPHAHCIRTDPSNRFALVADLGLDKVLVYRFDSRDGSLRPNDPPWVALAPGAGPRHLTFHPGGAFAYVINELASTVTAFAWDSARGTLTERQTISTLPAGFGGASTGAEIEVHPSGRWLYASNRGHDSLAVFAVDRDTGRLALIEYVPTRGHTPRNFAFDASGRWLVVTNHDSENAAVFRVDSESGRLAPMGQPVTLPNPFGVRLLTVP